MQGRLLGSIKKQKATVLEGGDPRYSDSSDGFRPEGLAPEWKINAGVHLKAVFGQRRAHFAVRIQEDSCFMSGVSVVVRA